MSDALLGRRGRGALAALGVVVSLFLAAPVLVMVPLAFSDGRALSLPPAAYSLRWFEALTEPRWRDAFLLSLAVALVSAAAATVVGTLAAIGIARLSPRLARLVRLLFLAPMIVPLMVVAVGFYVYFANLGLVGTLVSLPLAHMVLGLPVVVLPVLARLAASDPLIERAAASLGAGEWRVLTRVVLPQLRLAMVSGFALAFITSFDEVIVAQFLSGPRLETLPRRIWEGVAMGGLDNTLTAIATLQLALAAAATFAFEIFRRDGRVLAMTAPEAPAAPSILTATPATAHGVPIVFDGLTKRYRGAAAVDDFSLGVGAGEFLTILGPSGSGKTTLLMLVAGFTAPDAGRLLVAGRDVAPLPPHKRDIGVVFQNYALFPHLTVAENIAFPLAARGVPRAQIAARVDEALAQVRLAGFGARRIGELSGGQQQRVAFARAIVFRPAALLMDEPLSALDRALRLEMQAELRALQRAVGHTTIYVTHDQEEALNLSDRIAVMNQGRLQQVGTPAEIYARPKNPFVARFFGEANLLPGTVADGLFRADGVDLAIPAAVPAGPATACVRAEALGLGDGPGVAGRVVEARFSGSVGRIVVATGAGMLTLTQPTRPDATLPEAGAAVTVRVDPAAVHVMEGRA